MSDIELTLARIAWYERQIEYFKSWDADSSRDVWIAEHERGIAKARDTAALAMRAAREVKG